MHDGYCSLFFSASFSLEVAKSNTNLKGWNIEGRVGALLFG